MLYKSKALVSDEYSNLAIISEEFVLEVLFNKIDVFSYII